MIVTSRHQTISLNLGIVTNETISNSNMPTFYQNAIDDLIGDWQDDKVILDVNQFLVNHNNYNQLFSKIEPDEFNVILYEFLHHNLIKKEDILAYKAQCYKRLDDIIEKTPNSQIIILDSDRDNVNKILPLNYNGKNINIFHERFFNSRNFSDAVSNIIYKN